MSNKKKCKQAAQIKKHELCTFIQGRDHYGNRGTSIKQTDITTIFFFILMRHAVKPVIQFFLEKENIEPK